LSDARAIRTTGIVVALAAEARTLTNRAAPERLTPLADGAALWLSGMGLVAAQRAAQELVNAGAKALAVFGVAGALDSSLSSGTMLCPEQVLNESGERYITDASWRVSLQQSLTPTLRPYGSLLSVREPLLTIAEKANAHQRFGALAVDMESAAVAAVARQYSLPFISLRAIVDEASDTVPTALNNSVDAWGRPRALSMIAAMCRHPSIIGDLPRLYSRMQRATQALQAAYQAVGPTLGWPS
jgi:adenosylhomocysteine nucleosidase